MTYLEKSFDRVNVLGVGISAINPSIASSYLIEAVKDKKNSYVCVTGVHGIIESHRSKELKEIHNRSLLTVPDGMPAVWVGLEQGFYSMRKYTDRILCWIYFLRHLKRIIILLIFYMEQLIIFYLQ